MSWQDIVITTASLVFVVSLVPQVYLGFKNKQGVITYATSIPTTLGIVALCTTYLSLGLYYSFSMNLITATLWFLLFLQRAIYKNKA